MHLATIAIAPAPTSSLTSTRLDQSVTGADTALRLAESAGMEVSEARLNQDQARDAAHQGARHNSQLPDRSC